MKKVLLAAVLALSACNPVTTAVVTNQPVVSGQAAVITAKAWYDANAFYNVPAAAYRSANSRGLLSASAKAVVKPKLLYLFQLLKAAKAAKTAGDAVTFNDKLNAMRALSAEVQALIPKGPAS